jgi:hypothetical protein
MGLRLISLPQRLFNQLQGAFTVDKQTISAEELYSKMIEDGYTQGTKTRLFSCYAGSVEADGAASQLAKIAQATVVAPESWITVGNGAGLFNKGQAIIGDGLGWRLFK